MTEDKPKKSYADKLKRELIVFFAFFILTLISGVWAIRDTRMLWATLACIAFMIFNGFNITINLILKVAREVLKKDGFD